MNLRAMLLCGALSAATLPAADTLTGEFQRALFEEEANRNLPAAIAGYEAVIKRLDEQRQLAATAVFRLGESYRKLGKTNEAVSAYERIIREFADQETLVKLSGQNLSILKPSIAGAPTLDGNNASPSRRWMDSWSPSWQSFLEVVKGFEPMSDGELHTLATAVPEAGIVEAMAKVQKAVSAAERFKTHPEDFVIDAKNPNPVEALQLSKDELSNKRASALRTLEALAALERRVAGLGSARSDTGGPEGAATFQQEYLRLKSTLEQLKRSNSRDELKTLAQVLLLDASLGKLDEMEVAARSELAGHITEFGPEHGEVKKSQAKLHSIAKSIDERIAGAIRAAEIKLAALEQVATAQSDSTSSLDPATRAKQMELLEQEIALVEGQVRVDDERYKVGTITTERIRRQRELLVLRRQLAALEGTPQAMETQRQLIEEELKLIDQMNEATRLLVEAGRGSRDDLVTLERERMQLRRELIDLERGPAVVTNDGTAAAAMTTEEAEELRRVQALVANSPDLVNKREKDGLPPLHLAIQRGHLNVVRYLLANGASTSVTDKNGWPPLLVAAQNGQLSALRLLLEAGVPVDQSTGGRTALDAAAYAGNDVIVEFLLTEGANPDFQNINGSTPLHQAASRGLTSTIELLVAGGANVNAQDKDGRTSLHIASANGLTNAIELLIAGGAGLEISASKQREGKNVNGRQFEFFYDGTPLNFAVARLQFATADLLLKKGADPNPETKLVSPLSLAVQIGSTNFVHRLIQAGSVTTNEALVHLALGSMPAVIPFLLDAGANPNLHPAEAEPPLLIAVNHYLNQWGAEQDARVVVSGGGTAPLQPAPPGVSLPGSALNVGRSTFRARLATLQGKSEVDSADWEPVVKALVKHGAEVNATVGSQSVLTRLCQSNGNSPMEMIQWLLDQGADPNAGGGYGANRSYFTMPVLWTAISADNLELCRLLMKHGANVGTRDDWQGTSALHVAASGARSEVVKLLLEHKVAVDIVDDEGRTPLYSLLKRWLDQDDAPGGRSDGSTGPFGKADRNRHYAAETRAQLEQDILTTVELLLAAGAKLDGALADGFPPLHFAAAIEDDRFLKSFLQFKADPNTTNAVGVTPLHTAATKSQSENIRLLVQAGADVNRPDKNGDTPLHIAAILNRVQASEVLLELGADRERKNRFGRNPVENLLNDVKVNKRPPFGLPEYLDPIKNVTDVLGR